jgi:predicted anti-sigma-YlaC factor YlaD
MSAALAVGLVYAAWRPVRAFGLLPITGALAACMVVTAALDLAGGRAGALGEAHHVLDLAGLVLLWVLAGAPRWRPRVRQIA